MDIFGIFRTKNNPNDIYFEQLDRPELNCFESFDISNESKLLRVKNDHINALFRISTAEKFNEEYNRFRKYINLGKPISQNIDNNEIEIIEQKIIIHWIYYYTVNNSKVKVRRSDFTHPQTIGVINWHLKKLGFKKEDIIKTGSEILRMKEKTYLRITELNEERDNR